MTPPTPAAAGATRVTIVTGASAATREAAIAAILPPGPGVAMILEGLSDGRPLLVSSAMLDGTWAPA